MIREEIEKIIQEGKEDYCWTCTSLKCKGCEVFEEYLELFNE